MGQNRQALLRPFLQEPSQDASSIVGKTHELEGQDQNWGHVREWGWMTCYLYHGPTRYLVTMISWMNPSNSDDIDRLFWKCYYHYPLHTNLPRQPRWCNRAHHVLHDLQKGYAPRFRALFYAINGSRRLHRYASLHLPKSYFFTFTATNVFSLWLYSCGFMAFRNLEI